MVAASGSAGSQGNGYQPMMHQSGARPPAPADGDESIQARKIFLGGLPGPTTEDELMGIFSNFGPVQETIVIRRGGKPRGFGFVIFQTKAGADAVLAAHNSNGVVVGGRTIDCKSTFARGSEAERKHGATQGPPSAPHNSRYVTLSSFLQLIQTFVVLAATCCQHPGCFSHAEERGGKRWQSSIASNSTITRSFIVAVVAAVSRASHQCANAKHGVRWRVVDQSSPRLQMKRSKMRCRSGFSADTALLLNSSCRAHLKQVQFSRHLLHCQASLPLALESAQPWSA